MGLQKYPIIAIWRDVLVSTIVAVLILGGWVFVYFFFGEPTKVTKDVVTFLGGVLAISGLLFKHYLLKEVLDYLKSWKQLESLLDSAINSGQGSGLNNDAHINEFKIQRTYASKYSKYVHRELEIIPILPLVLIFLYGCALLSDKSIVLRAFCLYGMIHCVVYLAIAAMTSTKLTCAYPDLETTIEDLEKLICDLKGVARK